MRVCFWILHSVSLIYVSVFVPKPYRLDYSYVFCMYVFFVCFVVVQLLSCVWLIATPWTVEHQAPLNLEFVQFDVHWVGDAIQPSHPVVLFSSCLQSFSTSESFPVSWLFRAGGQSTGASASVLLVSIQGWSPLWLTGLISLQSKRPSSLLQYHNLKASILQHSAFFMVHLLHLYMSIGQTIALTIRTFVGKVMPLLFNMLSRFVRF